MKRVLFLSLLMILGSGCGGGGGGSDQSEPKVVGAESVIVQSGVDTRLSLEGSDIIIPTGTLPTGTAVELKLTDDRKPFPNDLVHPTFYKMEITAEAQPTGSITVKVPKPASANPFHVALLTDQGWKILDHEVLGDVVQYQLPAAELSPINTGRVIGFGWITQIANTFADNQAFRPPQLIRLHGNGKLGEGKSALIIHGIFSNAGSFSDFGRHLKNNSVLGYTNVYGITYDWRFGAIQNAEAIKALIESVNPSAKKVDIFAHSMGGLVSRYLLEELGYTRPFANLITMHTPHSGSGWGSPGAAVLHLNELLFNSPSTLFSGGYLTPASPAIQDLVTNSGLLTTLRFGVKNEIGQVGYAMIGATGDDVVPIQSARADDTILQAKTSGMVQRETIHSPDSIWIGGHSFLYTEIQGITAVMGMVAPRSVEGISLTTEANVVDAGSKAYWDFTFRLRNGSVAPIRITDIDMESFDRFGLHVGTQWYVPGMSGTLPFVYTPWGEVLQDNHHRDFNLRFNAGSELSGRLFTGSSIIHIRYDLNGFSYVKRLTFLFTREDEIPQQPITRDRPDGAPGATSEPTLSEVRR